jgi:hypothetical protein
VPRSYPPNWGQQDRASASRRCLHRGTTEPVGQRCATGPDPVAWIGPRHGHRPSGSSWTGAVDPSPRGCPPAEPAPNWDRPSGREPSALTGRRGGTNAFLGRGARPRSRRASLRGSAADPWISVWCSFVLTPSTEALGVARSEAVNSGPVITPRKENNLPPSAVRLLTSEAIEGFGRSATGHGSTGTELASTAAADGSHCSVGPRRNPAQGHEDWLPVVPVRVCSKRGDLRTMTHETQTLSERPHG